MKTSNKLSVLMLSIGYGNFGGVELGAERIRNCLVTNGVNVHVVASGKSGDIYRVPTFGFWRLFWPLFAYIRSLFILMSRDVDVIYARYAVYPMFLGIVLRFISKKPLVVSVHGGDIRHGFILGRIIKSCLRSADCVVCYDNKGHITKLKGMGIDPDVIPNGIDVRRFKPSVSVAKKKKVIYVGGTREIKGWFDVVSLSCRDELKNGGCLEFNIYGDGTLRSNNGVVFHPRASHDDMESVLETGQLFILPSYAEGVPSAMLEAMSKGMYVIASDLDFTRDVLDRKFLFKAGDINAMVNLVMKFRDERESFFGVQNKRNRKIVVEKYSIYDACRCWKKLFERVSKKSK